MPNPRPSADALLARIKKTERARLRIYIGAAPGVGKTYEMLQEAHALRARGLDVVVGFVETYGRRDTEAQLKDVIQKAWTAGGEPSMALMSGLLKQTASAFTGIAQQRHDAAGARPTTIIGAADVYVSDFGNIAFVPSRFTTGRDVLVIDPSLWKAADLQGYSLTDLAKTGHSDKKMLSREWTLVCENEAGNGVVADVQAA